MTGSVATLKGHVSNLTGTLCRRERLPLSSQGRPPPLPTATSGAPGCRSLPAPGHRPRPPPPATPEYPDSTEPNGDPARRSRASLPRGSGGFCPGTGPAAEAAPGRVRGDRGPGAASPPGGHVLSERPCSAAAALALARPAGQLPPAARPGPPSAPTSDRPRQPTCRPAPAPARPRSRPAPLGSAPGGGGTPARRARSRPTAAPAALEEPRREERGGERWPG
ncbi:translation initiation factor IF-2-like [Myiozetetes cayanensis]|uniref:translation initiation factor IF-2-like n=1 Tax=Myiozetetes cayanensis TaxID=478635 RepID=UPI00215FDC7C|nr:translation initiation factor IF-2-like [Myiozetetes cayanensis]